MQVPSLANASGYDCCRNGQSLAASATNNRRDHLAKVLPSLKPHLSSANRRHKMDFAFFIKPSEKPSRGYDAIDRNGHAGRNPIVADDPAFKPWKSPLQLCDKLSQCAGGDINLTRTAGQIAKLGLEENMSHDAVDWGDCLTLLS